MTRLLTNLVEQVNQTIPENEIVNDFLNLQLNAEKIDFLDIELVDGKPMFTYLPTNRLKSVPGVPAHELFFVKGRQSSRIGALMKKLLVEQYPDDQVKQFVEQLSAEFTREDYEIEVVKGEDIKPYYLQENYLEGPDSELWKNCMRYDHCQEYLGIYCHDPNVSLVVAKKDGAVAARALLWDKVLLNPQLTKGNTGVDKLLGKELKLLERIYAVSPIAKNVLWQWGLQNADLMHCVPKNAKVMYVTSTHERAEVFMDHPIARWQFNYYPWIDTLHYLDFDRRTLSNYKDRGIDRSGFGGWRLNVGEGRIDRLTNDSPKPGDVVSWLCKHEGKSDEELLKLDLESRERKLKKREKVQEAPTPSVKIAYGDLPALLAVEPRQDVTADWIIEAAPDPNF